MDDHEFLHVSTKDLHAATRAVLRNTQPTRGTGLNLLIQPSDLALRSVLISYQLAFEELISRGKIEPSPSVQ